jgi:DtxR family Mn-dependent transcriptional regulator
MNLRKSITSTKEDYLRAIYILQEKTKGNLRTTQVAKVLNLNKSTVSERLQELKEQKLIAPGSYVSVTLTAAGYRMAKKLTYKHRMIEVFLNKVLKVPKSQVHGEAHKLEHAFSDSTIKKLAHYLGKPKRDPHGSLIPQI